MLTGRLDRRSLVLVALALLVSAAVGTFRWNSYASAGYTDLNMFCASGRVLGASGNPYDPQVLEGAGVPPSQPLTMPPLLVRAYGPVCGMPPYWLAALAGVAVVVFTWRGLRVPLLLSMCAVFAGFGAFPWVAFGANHAMLEAIAVAAAAVAIAADAPLAFGVAIGVAAFMKSLVPLPMLLGAVRWQGTARSRAVAYGLAAVAGLHALQWLLNPDAAGQYWHAILTVYPEYAARDLNYASEDNPTPYAFLPILTRHAGLGSTPGVIAAVLVSASFFAGWVLAFRRVSREPGARVWAAMLVMAVIVVAHPRIKQYSPFALAPLLALGLARAPHHWRPALIGLTCVVPHASILLLVLPPVPTFAVFALQYSQWLVLAVTLALALRPDNILRIGRASVEDAVSIAR